LGRKEVRKMSRTTLNRNEIGQFADARIPEINKYIENVLVDYFTKFNDVDLFDLEVLFLAKIGWQRCQAMMREVPKKE
jgi:hypothetical protein